MKSSKSSWPVLYILWPAPKLHRCHRWIKIKITYQCTHNMFCRKKTGARWKVQVKEPLANSFKHKNSPVGLCFQFFNTLAAGNPQDAPDRCERREPAGSLWGRCRSRTTQVGMQSFGRWLGLGNPGWRRWRLGYTFHKQSRTTEPVDGRQEREHNRKEKLFNHPIREIHVTAAKSKNNL